MITKALNFKLKVNKFEEKCFSVWLRNRILSAGFEPVLGKTDISCIASNYRQFSTNINIKIKIIELKPVLIV